MKFLVFLAIILVVLAKKHHQPDPVMACLQGTCKSQFEACDNSDGCMKQLNKCMKKQESDPFNYQAGLDCLSKQKTAYQAFQCIFTQCLGFHGE